MSCKTIVVVASGVDEDAHVFGAAAKLASQFSGAVTVVPAYPDAAADYAGYGAALTRGRKAEAIARVRAGERETQEGLEALGREAAGKAGLTWRGEGKVPSFDVRLRELHPSDDLKALAPLADLTIFGAAAAKDPFLLSGFFAETLLALHAPILLVRSGALDVSRVAIAWDGSLQAARAVRAALPLLQAASAVFLFTNADDPAIEPVDLKPIGDFLMRHDVAATASPTLRGENIAASLLEAARANQCGLLVAGGYGRPRLLEFVLGGTTRALVNAADAPHLLLAH